MTLVVHVSELVPGKLYRPNGIRLDLYKQDDQLAYTMMIGECFLVLDAPEMVTDTRANTHWIVNVLGPSGKGLIRTKVRSSQLAVFKYELVTP